MELTKSANQGGSRRGYHYYDTFRECPRKFYFQRYLGLVEENESPAKVLGKAIHYLQECFARTGSAQAAQAALKPFLEEHRASFFEDSDFEDAWATVSKAGAVWLRTFADSDLATYTVVGAELTLEAEIADGVVLTGTIDRLYKHKETGALYLFDTKTSSTNTPERIINGTDLSDQLVLYKFLVESHFGRAVDTIVVDALAFRKGVDLLQRGELTYSPQEVNDTIEGFLFDVEDLRDRLAAVSREPKCYKRAFPRHTLKCSLFGCPYADICRGELGIEKYGIPMDGFKWVDPDVDTEEDVE